MQMWRPVLVSRGPRKRAHVPGWPSESASPNLMDQSLLYRSPHHPSSVVSSSSTSLTVSMSLKLQTVTTIMRLNVRGMVSSDLWCLAFLKHGIYDDDHRVLFWSHQTRTFCFVFFVSIVSMPFGKHPRCHVSFDSLTLLSFSSPTSRSARDPEEESSQLLSERRRGSFYHWKELPQRNQSYFSGKQCRYYSQLVVTLVVSRCKSCAFGFLHVK